MDPGWGSTWGSRNWCTSGNTALNSSIGIQPGGQAQNMQNVHPTQTGGILQQMQLPMWPGHFYSQHSPPGMFYPPNWGGYVYSMHQLYTQPNDDQMVIINDSDHHHNPVNSDVPAEPQDNMNSKGKEKVMDAKLAQLEKDDEEYRIKVKQCEVEDKAIPLEVLEIAHKIHGQDHVGDLEQQLKQVHELYQMTTSIPHMGSADDSSNTWTKQPPMEPSAEHVLAAAEGTMGIKLIHPDE
ncbi:hypothetical protein EDD18DRAFT_1105241 [Armillaria luteobubalina]|uniref:Uncharacterized protein n=1 Tax=Armillaria luteobubalina TaxID=153913 RepID=A0AA39Q7B1_9AGAR|nr:hypothetical protein EDD18DRAFT_1105241 [Armillaria luteobubalina]